MKIDVLLGLQWGDEGKGKIVDVLTPKYNIIARFQGGPNAGHTLEFNNIKHVLHLIPSGIFHKSTLNVIGNGVVIDPIILKKEIDVLIKMDVPVFENLIISQKAHLILPTHRLLDAAYESAKGNSKIGSTLKGIGPTYTDKISRIGLRVGDILEPDFKERFYKLVEKHKNIINSMHPDFKEESNYDEWLDAVEFLKKFQIVESEYLINKSSSEGKSILAEGAQGSLLDVDFGSYPFVTSSNTICAGACSGLGIAPSKIGEVFGIFKAYCTRVGSGPFPTELVDQDGEMMRKNGNEFGSTTGRARRCGWLDLPALKYSIMLNGVTQLIMTKADVLSSFETIKICTHYNVKGKQIDYVPFRFDETIEPVYKEMPGWSESLENVNQAKDIPQTLENYIRYIEAEVGVPVCIVSVGPDRLQTIIRK